MSKGRLLVTASQWFLLKNCFLWDLKPFNNNLVGTHLQRKESIWNNKTIRCLFFPVWSKELCLKWCQSLLVTSLLSEALINLATFDRAHCDSRNLLSVEDQFFFLKARMKWTSKDNFQGLIRRSRDKRWADKSGPGSGSSGHQLPAEPDLPLVNLCF